MPLFDNTTQFLSNEEVLLFEHYLSAYSAITCKGNASHKLHACRITMFLFVTLLYLNLYTPYMLYIGQGFRYPPESALYVLKQQIYFILFYCDLLHNLHLFHHKMLCISLRYIFGL
jgi:hypothetical protein